MRRITLVAAAFVLSIASFTNTAFAQGTQENESYFEFSVKGQATIYQAYPGVDQFARLHSYYVNTFEAADGSQVQDYNFTEEPLSFDYGLERGYGLALDYVMPGDGEGLFGGTTTLGFELSKFRSQASAGGMVESESPGPIRWIGMWGEGGESNLLPLSNQNHPSGFTPVRYRASTDFSMYRAKLFLEEELVNDGGYTLSINAGLNATYIKHLSTIGQNQTAHLEQRTEFDEFIFHNEVTLRTDSESRSWMVGPSMGLTLQKNMGSWNLSFSGSKELAFSWNKADFHFTDIDDITTTYTAFIPQDGTPPQVDRILLDGDDFFEKFDSNWVSNTALDFQAVRTFGGFELGVGTELTLWNGLPLAPTYHNPWALTGGNKAPPGKLRQLEKRDVVLQNLYAYVKIKL